MNKESVIQGITELTKTSMPPGAFQEFSVEDEYGTMTFTFIRDSYVGFELTIDYRDEIISLLMLRLQNGKPYKTGYYANKEVGPIRLYFIFVALYFGLPCDRNEFARITSRKDKNSNLIGKIEERVKFFSPIFNNEKGVFTELQKPEVWEAISKYSKTVKLR